MNIGLLLTYNEADIIEEMMEHNRGMIDTIFVLDGSDDGTDRILASYPEVELILKDGDVALPVQQRLTWYSPFWVEIRQPARRLPRRRARSGLPTGRWLAPVFQDADR